MQRVLPGTSFGHPPTARTYLVKVCFTELETSPALPGVGSCELPVTRALSLSNLPGAPGGNWGQGCRWPELCRSWCRAQRSQRTAVRCTVNGNFLLTSNLTAEKRVHFSTGQAGTQYSVLAPLRSGNQALRLFKNPLSGTRLCQKPLCFSFPRCTSHGRMTLVYL